MTKRGFAVLLALVSLLVVSQPVAATGPPPMSMTVLGGGGVLSNASTFAVQVMSLSVAAPGHPVSIQRANFVLDGVHTACTVDTITPCTEVTLTCGGTPHDVIAGVPSVSLGSVDGVDVTQGFIFMRCFSRP